MSQQKLYRDRNLLIVFGVTLMSILTVSSITPAFPKIVDELNISVVKVGLLITAFNLPGVILTPLIGVLADRYGRKRILVPALFLFGLAGLACALTRDFNTLLALMVVQGVGGAALGSLNLTLIGDMFTGERRAGAMGLNSTVISIGVALFPLIGGALAMLAWSYPFFLSLAAIPIGIIVLRYLDYPEPRNSQSLREYLGGTWGYLKNLKVASAFATAVIVFIIVYGPYLTYFSLFLGSSFYATPFVIGVIMSGMAIGSGTVASQLGRIVRLISATNLVKLGFAIQAVALALIPLMPDLWLMLVPSVLFGLGGGVMIPSLQTYIAGAAPIEYRAAFMSVNATMFRLGQTLGPLVFAAAYASALFNGVFFAAAGLAAGTAIVGFIGGRAISRQSAVNSQ